MSESHDVPFDDVGRHFDEVESLSDWAISHHLIRDHGYRDQWPYAPRERLIAEHRGCHLPTTTHVSSDKTQVSTDKVDIAVEDGQPRTEDEEVTVMAEAQVQTIADLERQVAELTEKLANEVKGNEQRRLAQQNQAIKVALDLYKERVRDQVRHYMERGDLCVAEAKNINDELDLDMTFGWKVTGTVEFTFRNVDEEPNTYSIENRIAEAVRDLIEGELAGDDVECEEVSVDLSCEEQE